MKHPKGLYLLFFTEMWERFSYYGMQALLMIYMVSSTAKGGLGWDAHTSGQIYGAYVGLVYFTPLIGGYLADRYFGSRLCILIGAFLIVLGHFSLAFTTEYTFFLGLGLLVLGVGFFKSNISSILGKLYPEGSPLVDSGYTIFYLSINAGSILGTLLCAYLGERVGWHYGFGVAAIGMTLSFLVFYFGQGVLGDAGKAPEKGNDNTSTVTFSNFSKVEKDRLGVIFILSAFSIIFWMAWEQMFASVSIFALSYTDRNIAFLNFEVPVGWFQALNPIFVSILAPFMAFLWNKLAAKNKDFSIPVKILLGIVLMAVAFLILVVAAWGIAPGAASASVSMWYLVAFYFFQVIAEICQYPVSLSAVSKLSPKSFYSIMFGVYFTAIALGNYLAGAISGFIEEVGKDLSLSWFFMLSVIFLLASALVMVLFIPKIKKMMHGIH